MRSDSISDEPTTVTKTRDPEERMRSFRRVLSALMRSDAAGHGDLASALAHLTEIAAETMRVERAGVWRFSQDRSQLVCEDLYERGSDRHLSGMVLDASDKPRYFQALQDERSVAAHDAASDPRTNEFADSYLRPHGIVSMLDAPILFQGDLVGVVCIEHVGEPRRWQPWEELACGSFADFVAMVLAVAQLHAKEAEVEDARQQLDRKRSDITRRGLRPIAAEAPRAFFEWTPAALIVLSPEDGELVAINRRAKALLRHFDAGLTARDIGELFLQQEDKNALLKKIDSGLNTFRVEATLACRDGHSLEAKLHAQVMQFDGEPALVVAIEATG